MLVKLTSGDIIKILFTVLFNTFYFPINYNLLYIKCPSQWSCLFSGSGVARNFPRGLQIHNFVLKAPVISSYVDKVRKLNDIKFGASSAWGCKFPIAPSLATLLVSSTRVKCWELMIYVSITGDSQFSCFDVERIFGVNLVETSPGVEEDLPDVIDVPLPLVAEPSLDVHLVCGRINERMEDIVIENQTLEENKTLLINFKIISR